MNHFRRRHRRTTAGSIYGPARHRVVDARYAAALVEVGIFCQTDAGAAARRSLPSGPTERTVAGASAGVTAAETSAPNVHLLTFHGELDVSKKDWIETALAAIERFSPATVAILDLTDVQYLDTTFLNALLRAERLFGNDASNRPRIVAPRSSMSSRVFALTNLDAQFDVFEDLASAQRG